MIHRRARLARMIAAQAAAAQQAAPDAQREITEIRSYSLREPVSQKTYAVLAVRTRGGLTGHGEGPVPSAADLARARQFWTGRPATAYATAPPGLPLAGAMDMALLDIAGKVCKAPVYRLLGGPTRNKVRALAALTGASDLDRAVAAGFRAFRIPVPKPAARNQGQAYQRSIRQLFETLRARGEQFDFVLDAGGALTAGDAGSVAATLQAFHPLWLDEPCAASNDQTVRKIAEETVVPLGFGDPAVYLPFLRESLIDVLRPDVATEGISAVRRMAALAETYYVAVAPRHSGGPVATAAALHLAASLPNFFILDIPLPAVEEDERMRSAIAGTGLEKVRDGFAALPSGAGLGINVSEAALERYHAA